MTTIDPRPADGSLDTNWFPEDSALRFGPGFDGSHPTREKTGPDEWTPFPTMPGYEFLAELGRGGIAVVYRARQLKLNRTVALKMLLSGSQAQTEDRLRFQSEAEAVARLQHPHIVQIFEVGFAAGQPYLVLEYVDGGSLSQRIGRTPQLPRHAAELVETIARAVHAAHEQGILHRDLKPSNILLATTSPGNQNESVWSVVPKITDFGLAKILDRPSDLTQSRDILGTPSYMAPEQAQGS